MSDTGAGQAEDTNLGYKTFLNGLDTSAVATDTIDYVATDSRQQRPIRHINENRPHRSGNRSNFHRELGLSLLPKQARLDPNHVKPTAR